MMASAIRRSSNDRRQRLDNLPQQAPAGGTRFDGAFDPNGLLDDLKKALAERVRNAEMDHHLTNGEAGNSRNGYREKTAVTDTARIELDVPRDRQSTSLPSIRT
jgi:transposase-like protein